MTKETETKEHKIVFLPKDSASFIQDIQNLLYLNKEQLSIILDEFQKRHDSFSTVHVSKLLSASIDIVNAATSLIIYLNHLIAAHGLPLTEIEKELLLLGWDKERISVLTAKLKTFDDKTKADIEKLYWSFRDVAMEGHVTDIEDSLRFNTIHGEGGKLLGLLPTMKIQFQMSSNLGEKKEIFNVYGSLDDLGILIKRLQETYEYGMHGAKRLKQDLKEQIICVPEEEDV